MFLSIAITLIMYNLHCKKNGQPPSYKATARLCI